MNKSIKISTVTTLKAPLEITLSFVRYHLNSGIDHMYLFFDDPNDDAITLLMGEDRVTIIKCNQKHWNNIGIDPQSMVHVKQGANATHAFQLARTSGFDWMIHIDSDELIYGSFPVSEYLQKVSEETEIVRFPVMEATPQKLFYKNAFEEIEFFKVFSALPYRTKKFKTKNKDVLKQKMMARLWHTKKYIASILGSKHSYGTNFFQGYTTGKSAIRASARIQSVKSHLPEPIEGTLPTLLVSNSHHILHYDCLGFENWKLKWKDRVEKNLWVKVLSKNRKILHNEIENSINNEDKLKSLYLDLYSLSGYESYLLRLLGMIKIIHLPKELFHEINR